MKIHNLADYAKSVVKTARAVANSKGGQELMESWNLGRAEAANLLLHGHAAAIYSSGQSPPEIQEPSPAEQHAQANQISTPEPVEPTVQQSNQISMDDYTIDHDKVVHSEPITPQPEMEM